MYKQSFYKFTAKFIAASLIVMLALTALPAPTASAATDTFETAGTFTWTAPAGVTSVTVSVWGGGGKGGSISGGSGETTGGGGGGGAYSTKTNIAVTPGTGYSVIVGAGSSSTAAGGDSYFIDASTVLAKGGNSVADNNNNGVSGGASASGVGTNKYSGGSGANGSGNGNRGGGGGSSAGTGANGGNGNQAVGGTAPTGGGNGGNAASSSSGDGTAGFTPGGAGGGAYRSTGSSSYNGGNGADGKVVITYTGPSAPTVISPTATSITSITATLGANISSFGGGTISEHGTCYNTTATPRINCSTLGTQASTGTFTDARSGLTAGTKYFYAGYATNGIGPGYSPDGSFYTEPSAQASLGSFTAVSSTGMTVNWTNGTDGDGVIVLMKASSAITGVPADGIYTTYTANTVFGSGYLLTDARVVYKGAGTSVTVTGLTVGTTYYVAVFEYKGMENTSGVNLGTNYLTPPATGSQATNANLPTLTTPTATSIGSTTVRLGANITSNGGGILSERGTCWNTTSPVVNVGEVGNNCSAATGTSTGVFTHDRTGLTAGSKIYYKGYATNTAGSGYSSEGSFYLEPSVQAKDVTFPSVSSTSMTINWTRGTGGDGVIVLMKAGSAITGVPTDGTFAAYGANTVYGSGALITDGYVVSKQSGTSVTVTGLTAGVTYYVAVFEYKGSADTVLDAQGTNYKLSPATGSQMTTITAPTVSNGTATAIRRAGATLHGTVNAKGSSTVVTFQYGTDPAFLVNTTTGTAAESPVTGSVDTSVSYVIPGGLTSGTLYYFRAVGTNGAGTSYGSPAVPFSPVSGTPKTYYVDKTNTLACLDGNGTSGGTLAAPFCTISYGAGVADAGDTVRVLAGTYLETVKPSNSGGPDKYITFSAAPGVIVKGEAGNFTNGGAFRLYNKGYIKIDGFTITETADYGIYVSTSNNIGIFSNHVSNSGSSVNQRMGIYLTGTVNSIISGNTTDHNYGDGIRLNNGSNYNTVSDNISFSNATLTGTYATGINLFNSSSHNMILHNTTYANEDTGLNFYTSSSYNQVIGNLSYGNSDHGIDHNAAPYNSITGNTVYGNVTTGINLEAGSDHAVVNNNISVDNGYRRYADGTYFTTSNPGNIRVDGTSNGSTTMNYDIVYCSTCESTAQIIWGSSVYYSMAEFKGALPGQEVNGLQANPLFTAPAPYARRPLLVTTRIAEIGGNYYIMAGSPAIDSANSDAPYEPTLDIAGKPREDDPAVEPNTGAGTRTYDDRGAYEYQSSRTTTSTSLVSDLNPSIYGTLVTFTATVSESGATGTIKFYDGATLLGTVPLSGGTPNKATYSTSVLTAAASPHSITANYLGDIYYASSTSAPLSQVVNPKALTITASSGTMTYGGTVPTITPGYSGLLAGDSAPATPPTCSTTATILSPVATYPSSCSGAVDANYTITYIDGSVSVTPATPTVTWSNAADITYGTALSATQLNATASVAGTFTYSPVSGTILLPGNGQSLAVDFVPTDSTNYSSVLGTTVKINVLKATLTVTATGIDKVFDGNTSATVTLSDNRVAGDIINDHYTTASFATSAVGIGITVNVSGITIDGANASYYILGNTTATTTANIFGIGTTTVITNAAELATPTLAGHSYPVSFSVTPDISGTLSGNVTVSDGTGATCNVSVTGTVASGTCDLTSTTVGIKSLTATFVSDDPNYGGSTSNPVLHTVYLIFRIYLPLVIRP